MRSIMIGAITLAAVGLVVSACTTHETRIVERPAVVGAAPGTSTTVITTDDAAPVVVETEGQRNIIVNVD